MVEYRSCKPKIVSSNPTRCSNKFSSMDDPKGEMMSSENRDIVHNFTKTKLPDGRVQVVDQWDYGSPKEGQGGGGAVVANVRR